MVGDNRKEPVNVVVMGATGAVGEHVVRTLLETKKVQQLSLLGRRFLDVQGLDIHQHKIDVFEPDSYKDLIPGHCAAVCTLGVGQPSKMSKSDFLKIDKNAVLDFAVACQNAGVRHFTLLASVGIDAQSRSFYLRAKGQLVDEISALGFERFSVFEPSMILTPKNRYGLSQAVVLAIWPYLNPLFFGKLKKYRGIPVALLGQAIANNIFLSEKEGQEHLQWSEFMGLTTNDLALGFKK